MNAPPLAMLLLVALTSLGAHGQADEGLSKAVPVDELKRLYTACERSSMRRVLGAEEIAQCSVVYEALKQRAFGGDLEKLLVWSRAQPELVRLTP